MLRWPDGDAIHASSEMWFKNEWIRNIYIYISLFWQARSLGSTIGSPRSSSHSYRACSSPVQWCGRWIHPWFESEEIPTGGATEHHGATSWKPGLPFLGPKVLQNPARSTMEPIPNS
jgi:hypothetical protein